MLNFNTKKLSAAIKTLIYFGDEIDKTILFFYYIAILISLLQLQNKVNLIVRFSSNNINDDEPNNLH